TLERVRERAWLLEHGQRASWLEHLGCLVPARARSLELAFHAERARRRWKVTRQNGGFNGSGRLEPPLGTRLTPLDAMRLDAGLLRFDHDVDIELAWASVVHVPGEGVSPDLKVAHEEAFRPAFGARLELDDSSVLEHEVEVTT